jgi:hypothetical protein
MSHNIVWDWGLPRTSQGYWDMGPIRIPPVPQRIIYTDRADGKTLWLLTWNKTLSQLAITNPIQVLSDKAHPDVNPVYGSGEEPYLCVTQTAERAGIRLFVKGSLDSHGVLSAGSSQILTEYVLLKQGNAGGVASIWLREAETSNPATNTLVEVRGNVNYVPTQPGAQPYTIHTHISSQGGNQ